MPSLYITVLTMTTTLRALVMPFAVPATVLRVPYRQYFSKVIKYVIERAAINSCMEC